MLSKRGISAIVATVLIILITVAAIMIVWLTIIPTIETSLEFSELWSRPTIMGGGYTAYDSDKEIAIVQVKRDFDEAVVDKVKLIFSIGGNSFSSNVVAPSSGQTKVYIFDLSEYMRDEGDIANVPDVFTNSFTKGTQSTQGAEVTTEASAQVAVQLAINTHDYIAFIIGDKDAKQILRSFDFSSVYARKAAGTLRNALEDALFGLYSGLSNAIGDTATVLADPEIRQGIYTLENANIDTLDGDTAFFFHPYTFYVQLGAVAKYYDQSQRGPDSASGFVQNGNMGQGVNRQAGMRGVLYGIPSFVSSRVVSGLQTYRNLLANKMAFGFATQFQPTPLSASTEEGRIRAQSSYELRNIGWLTVVDMIYGVIEMRDDHAVLLNGSSAFIGS